MAEFNLEKIVSHIGEHPLLEPNRFRVMVIGPEEIKMTQSILFNCHRCDIPGHSIMSFEHSIVGPNRKIPNEEVFDDLNTSFYNTHHLDEIMVMHKWLKLIGGKSDMRIAYYNDIVSDMQIDVYDLRENLIAMVKIYEAYPIGMSEVEMSYAGEAPSELTINWAFHSYEIDIKDKQH